MPAGWTRSNGSTAAAAAAPAVVADDDDGGARWTRAKTSTLDASLVELKMRTRAAATDGSSGSRARSSTRTSSYEI